MFVRLAECLIRYRWGILPFLAVVTLIAATLAPWISFDFTPQAVYSDHDGLVTYSERFKEAFGYEDAMLVVLIEAKPPRDVLRKEILTWQARTAAELTALESVKEVKCVANLQTPRFVLRNPWVIPVELIRQVPVDPEAEQRVRRTLERFDLANGALVSEDRRVAAVIVRLDPERRDIESMDEMVGAVGGYLDEYPPPSGYRLHLAGFPAQRVDIVRQLRADLAFLIPVAGLVLFVALAIAYRCLSGALVPLLAVGAGVMWTAALLVLCGQTISIISSILPVLMLTIGMSNCVHVINCYGEHRGDSPRRRLAAVRKTIAHMAPACLLTFLTTAIGFLSLTTTHSAVLTAFGWQAGIGMVFLYIGTILVSATMLPMFHPPKSSGRLAGPTSPTTRFVTAAGYLVCRHPWPVLVLSATLVGTSLWGARDMVVNSHMMESYDGDHPTMRAMRLVEDRLSGFISLDISLTADRPGRFLEPDIYRRVARAQQLAAEHEEVIFAKSYVDLHQRFHTKPGMRGKPLEKLPSDGDEGELRLQRSERMIRQMASAVDYGSFMTPDGMRTRVMLRIRDVGTSRALEIIDDLEKHLAELFPADGPVEARMTGDAYVHAKTIDGFVRALLWSLLGASVVIFALIAVLFRSLAIGMISIFPNLTPLVLTMGYMSLRGYDLNITHAIVFAISLGVAVDGTIHFLARFQRERKLDNDGAEAIRRTFLGTGRAIVLSNLLLLCGLAVLFLSDFVPTRRFAELGSITMASALIGDLLLLPACLILYDRFRKGRRVAAKASPE